MKKKVYKKGEIIFSQGDAADCMYEIQWGKVGIFSRYGTDGEKKLTELNAGFFGEMGLVEHEPRSAAAVALENHTALMEITEQELDKLLAERPAKVFAIMQHLSNRLRRLTRDYMQACQTVAELSDSEEKNEAESEELSARAQYYSRIAESNTGA